MKLIHHPRYIDHRQGHGFHPERPERLEATLARLKAEGQWREVIEPQAVGREDILRVHDAAYIEQLENFGEGAWDPDTYVREETFGIAELAAGGVVLAADLAFAEGQPAFALVRPPGHHATGQTAMGFCYLNNIAIAAARLGAQGKGRVVIVDIDVHHGNGTNDIFFASDQVLFISLHQYPHYPGTGGLGTVGEGPGEGFTVNIPLPAGSGDATYRDAFDRVVEPVIEQFDPAMVLVSVGVDAHDRDPLASMTLSSPGLVEQVDRLRALAGRVCEGRLAMALEGGYDVDALAEVVTGIVARARDGETAYRFPESPDTQGLGRRHVDAVIESVKPYWKLDRV